MKAKLLALVIGLMALLGSFPSTAQECNTQPVVAAKAAEMGWTTVLEMEGALFTQFGLELEAVFGSGAGWEPETVKASIFWHDNQAISNVVVMEFNAAGCAILATTGDREIITALLTEARKKVAAQ